MSEDPKISKTSQLNALRALHKMEKGKRESSASPPKLVKNSEVLPPVKAQPDKKSSSNAVKSNNSVKNSDSEPYKDSASELKKPKEKPLPIGRQTERRDISITLNAYNCQLKKAEDKEFFNLRQDMSKALIKMESLDTRDLVIELDPGHHRSPGLNRQEQRTKNSQTGVLISASPRKHLVYAQQGVRSSDTGISCEDFWSEIGRLPRFSTLLHENSV